MARAIVFNRDGYDTFIDFLKAYSIVMVVIAHTLPQVVQDYTLFALWGGMQVPVYILIQVFHAYKRGARPRWHHGRMIGRILIPFLAVQALILAVLILRGMPVDELLSTSLQAGGYGPGSYFIWVYLQMALLLVLLFPWVKGRRTGVLFAVFLGASILMEILCSLTDMPEWLYRILAVRYLFLIPLGVQWVRKGIVMSARSIVLSAASMAAVVFFSFTEADLEPWFFNTGWRTHRWICYYYVAALLPFALHGLFRLFQKSACLSALTRGIAKISYEVFLAQMAVFSLFPMSRLQWIGKYSVRLTAWVVLALLMSLAGGWMLWRLRTWINGEK